MPESLGEATSAIEARLSELRGEQKRLEGALGQLQRWHPPKERQRARHGQRLRQLLAVIESEPGIPASETALSLDIRRSQANNLLSRALAYRLIVRDGLGYALSEQGRRQVVRNKPEEIVKRVWRKTAPAGLED
jgi:hypothetical protein